jgi:hypothetical protein
MPYIIIKDVFFDLTKRHFFPDKGVVHHIICSFALSPCIVKGNDLLIGHGLIRWSAVVQSGNGIPIYLSR